MRQFEITRELFGKAIHVCVIQPDQGLHVSVFGGELSHIGAVTTVNPDGAYNTVQFPAHKDGAVSERWAKELARAVCRPVVVEAGIHYDNLNRQGISQVLLLTEEMLAEVLEKLSDGKTPCEGEK
jgi:tagatose-1,6-bisphosphate aldolase non-catalytic subunit AgaZ/GatZ